MQLINDLILQLFDINYFPLEILGFQINLLRRITC